MSPRGRKEKRGSSFDVVTFADLEVAAYQTSEGGGQSGRGEGKVPRGGATSEHEHDDLSRGIKNLGAGVRVLSGRVGVVEKKVVAVEKKVSALGSEGWFDKSLTGAQTRQAELRAEEQQKIALHNAELLRLDAAEQSKAKVAKRLQEAKEERDRSLAFPRLLGVLLVPALICTGFISWGFSEWWNSTDQALSARPMEDRLPTPNNLRPPTVIPPAGGGIGIALTDDSRCLVYFQDTRFGTLLTDVHAVAGADTYLEPLKSAIAVAEIRIKEQKTVLTAGLTYCLLKDGELIQQKK